MFLEAYRKQWGDELYSKFTSERGELRSALRQIRRETPIEQREEKQLQKLADDISRLDTKNVTADYLRKGYLMLLRNESERLFKAFHRVISVYINLIEDMKRCSKTAQTMLQEAERNNEQGKKLMATQVLHKVNEDFTVLENGIKSFFANVDSRNSLSITARKLLDQESLERTIIYEFRQEAKLDGDYLKNLGKLDKAMQKSLRAATESAIKEDIESGETQLSGDIQKVVVGLNQITSDLVQDLNRISDKIAALIDPQHGRGTRQVDKTKLPSITVLADKVSAGGYGFPLGKGKKTGSEYLLKETAKLIEFFQDQEGELKKQLRMLLAQPEQAKVRVS